MSPPQSKAAAQADLPPALADLHRQVLRAFLASGRGPGAAELRRLAGALGLAPGESLQRLADADLVHTDPATGAAITAYPFSGVPTPHVVRVDGAPPLYAMCAIDALGIPLMVGRNSVITSLDPASHDTITVEHRAGTWRWQPPATVVLIAGAGAPGPSLRCTCPFITFHATASHAAAYLREGTVAGRVVTQTEAIDAARAEFGLLLAG
jgi:Alkylmercury lyase